MLKWYEMKCVNHRDWMIENFKELNLNYQEIVLCMMVDFYNSENSVITYDMLADKMNTSIEDIDLLISELVSKDVMIIGVDNGNMTFDLTNLFEMSYLKKDDYDTVFSYFEDSFNRPLNSTELNKISDFLNTYSKEDIINAIRTADANQKLSIAYIEGILRNTVNDKKD